MDADELQKLIRQREPEGLKLDFKRKLYAINDPKNQERQWNEFIKDILALANGNVGTAQQRGYLVIGVADKLNQHGSRDLFDVGDIHLSEKDILTRVNKVCRPRLPDISCNVITFEGKRLLVIEIPPSPYLHETIYPLTMPNGTTYSDNTVFIRRKEDIGQAGTFERQAILAEKQGVVLSKPLPPKFPTQAKRAPAPPPKSVKKMPIGWLALLVALICSGLLTFGVVMNLILSASPRQTTSPTVPVQVASLQENATPESTPTQQPTNTPTPKPTDTATPTNTAVVPPTNTPTAVVLPTDTSPPAASVDDTGDVMTVDNWEIRVERIEFADKLSAFDRVEKAAGRFALIFLAVTNRGLSPDTFVAFGTAEVRDGEGRPYEEDSVVGGMAQYLYKTDIGADVNPDETAYVVTVFDIPKRSDTYILAPGSLAEASIGTISLQIP